MKLEGSVALVFGGARGMGRAFCLALAKHGAKVFVCDIREKEGQETCSLITSQYGADRGRFRMCDVLNPETIKGAYSDVIAVFGVPDVVLNHVGTLNENNWRFMLELNITPVIESTKQALEYMSKSVGGKGGVIVNTSSIAGVVAERSFAPVYSATKAAVVHYSRVMSTGLQFAKHGVRMMTLCPAVVDTDMVPECVVEGNVELAKDHQAFIAKRRVTGEILQPEWVADVMIDMVQRDEEFSGVAAVMETRKPEFYFKE